MVAYPVTHMRRRTLRVLLGLAGPALAAVMMGLGLALLTDPRFADDLGRIGLGPGLRASLGACHVAGGLALLAPSLAERASVLLGLLVGVLAAYLYAIGQNVMAGGPTMTALVLVGFGVSTSLRDRASAQAWQSMLVRYAERSEVGEPEES